MKTYTLQQLINAVERELKKTKLAYGHGTTCARDEALALVFQTLRLPFDERSEKKLNGLLESSQVEEVLQVLHQRISTRKPLPYLIHEAYFAGLSFYVDERVLIPRSPLAECIEKQFSPWMSSAEDVHRILDIGTGSGCMAVACAKAFPNAQIDATDISPDALAVAQINVDRHQVASQVHLMISDVFEKLKNQTYDVIISNPPYVNEEELKELPAEYLHEPKNALFAQDEGLAIVLRILKSVDQHLNEKGILIVEVGNSRSALEDRLLDGFQREKSLIWLDFERGDTDAFLYSKTQY
jgi:ribosomal protein L3 glutamine methyltransferase